MNLREYLDVRGVSFESMEHHETYTAQSLAQAVHVSGNAVAKTVLLCVDDDYVVAVLPATHSIDFERIEEILSANFVQLASERECGEIFHDCELGVVPPFGSHYYLKTLMDESLLEEEDIVFEGETHFEAVRVRCTDYVILEQPITESFSHHY